MINVPRVCYKYFRSRMLLRVFSGLMIGAFAEMRCTIFLGVDEEAFPSLILDPWLKDTCEGGVGLLSILMSCADSSFTASVSKHE